jgi:hypothetical protein
MLLAHLFMESKAGLLKKSTRLVKLSGRTEGAHLQWEENAGKRKKLSCKSIAAKLK